MKLGDIMPLWLLRGLLRFFDAIKPAMTRLKSWCDQAQAWADRKVGI